MEKKNQKFNMGKESHTTKLLSLNQKIYKATITTSDTGSHFAGPIANSCATRGADQKSSVCLRILKATRMLPPEILDQVTSLNIQHREIVAVINQLTRLQGGQFELDELSNTIRTGFAKADKAVEVLVHFDFSKTRNLKR